MSFKAFLFYLRRPITFVRRIGYFIYELRHPDEPWLAPKSVRFLDDHLKKDMTLFEWGSGRSTLWFAERTKKVVSIEYHEDWAKKVKQMVEERKVENVDLRYIPLEHPRKAPTPKHYETLPQYVAEIQKFSAQYFDVILIDGHYRLTCADQCLSQLKNKGYLIIDNSNRVKLEEWGIPENWPIVHESENVVTRTTIWQKSE